MYAADRIATSALKLLTYSLFGMTGLYLSLRNPLAVEVWCEKERRTYHHPSKNVTEIGAIVFNRNSGALNCLPPFP